MTLICNSLVHSVVGAWGKAPAFPIANTRQNEPNYPEFSVSAVALARLAAAVAGGQRYTGRCKRHSKDGHFLL